MLIHLAAGGFFRRSRTGLTLLIVAVIAIGLASRRGYVPFPAVLGNYPGDALWAWVVLLCVAWLRPAITRGSSNALLRSSEALSPLWGSSPAIIQNDQ